MDKNQNNKTMKTPLGDIPGKTDEEPAAGLGRVALLELEHVAARLSHRRHLGDHRQVVDHEPNLDNKINVFVSVGDPYPEDLHVFGPPGSGSISL
jgi:hypothetical protein